MSWDLSAYREDPADPQRRQVLGTVDEVLGLIERDASLDRDGPYWCTYRGRGFSVEIGVGGHDSEPTDPIDRIDLEIRGSGDPLPFLRDFARRLGLTLLDFATGEEVDLGRPDAAGWERHRAVRDRALAEARKRHGPAEDGADTGPGSGEPDAQSRGPGEGGGFEATALWFSGRNDPLNLVACDGAELLLATVLPGRGAGLEQRFRESGQVWIPERLCKIGTRRIALCALLEVEEVAATPSCWLQARGWSAPNALRFADAQAKADFVRYLLARRAGAARRLELETLPQAIGPGSPWLLALAAVPSWLLWPAWYAQIPFVAVLVAVLVAAAGHVLRGPRRRIVHRWPD